MAGTPTPYRLLAFAGLLAIVFGIAAFAGSRIDAHPGRDADGPAAMAAGHDGDDGAMAGGAEDAAGHLDGATAPGADDAGGHAGGGAAGEGAHAADAVRGLAVSDGGLTLELSDPRPAAGEPFPLSFRILDEDGRPLRNFDLEHAKRMHVIVARRDLTGFQHLHPVLRADGSWTVPATLTEPGSYRVFADFKAGGAQHTLAGDVTVDGPARSRELPPASGTATVDGFRVTRTTRGDDVSFEVTRDGRPVAVQDYLGAKGHLVALREGDLAFLHVHPHDDELAFTTELPHPGTYRLYLQFKVDGRVHTAEFTEEAR